MDKNRKKILSGRIELASNAVASSAFAIAGVLVYDNGSVVFENVGIASFLVLSGIALYIATTWLLYEFNAK